MKGILRWLGILLAAYLLVVLPLALFEESLIFFPSGYGEGDWTAAGLPVEDAWFQAEDGVRLHGWYLPHPQPLAVVLFCHGNGGNITHRADVLRMHRDRVGTSILVFDYRGYGRSEGRPSEQGILADARAARKWLVQRTGIAPDKLVLIGESLGGGVAVDLAAHDGAAALVLESTFTSLSDVGTYHYPWLPVRWLLRTRLDSLSLIGRYQGPLLASHPRRDSIIPYRLGRQLFEAAPGPKEWIELQGDHNDPRPVEYYDRLHAFLEAHDGHERPR